MVKVTTYCNFEEQAEVTVRRGQPELARPTSGNLLDIMQISCALSLLIEIPDL